jgi:hypothetical protein
MLALSEGRPNLAIAQRVDFRPAEWGNSVYTD